MIEGRDAHQRGNLFAVELAQFGQTRDQGQDSDFAQTIDLI